MEQNKTDTEIKDMWFNISKSDVIEVMKRLSYINEDGTWNKERSSKRLCYLNEDGTWNKERIMERLKKEMPSHEYNNIKELVAWCPVMEWDSYNYPFTTPLNHYNRDRFDVRYNPYSSLNPFKIPTTGDYILGTLRILIDYTMKDESQGCAWESTDAKGQTTSISFGLSFRVDE